MGSYRMTALALAAVLVLGACGKDEAAPASEKIVPLHPPEAEKAKAEEPVKEEWPHAYPLTGIGTKTESSDRAVAVMINNHMDARPQSGLAEADVVYEVTAEGEVTRFLAIFQSEKPEEIGPVRSARDYFIELAQGYDALYIAHGYSPDAFSMLMSGKYDQLNGMQYDGTLFKRASFRKAPHNSYIAFSQIGKGAGMENYKMDEPPVPLSFLKREELSGIKGEKAEKVTVAYDGGFHFTSEYVYDEKRERYERSSDGVKTADYGTDKPVGIDNLLIIETEHRVIDAEGRNAIDLTSGGDAILFQKGKARDVEWKNKDGRLLPYEGGQPAKLVPGKTWILIVPDLSIASKE